VKPLEAFCRTPEGILAEVQRAAVVALEDEEPHHRGGPSLERLFQVMELPRDFPILRPFTVTMLLCSQYFTNGFPVAPSLCAISHS